MTAMKQLPNHLYTVGEYAALGETEHRTELQEGIITVSPSPTPDHMDAIYELASQLKRQVSPDLKVTIDVDVDLELVSPGEPGTIRRPDVVVVDRKARLRVRDEGGTLRASDVRLIIEVVSPGSRRTDYVTKRSDYADAGIPHYWIVDLDEPVSLLPCELSGKDIYVDRGEVTGVFTTDVPFQCSIDLPSLLNL